MARTPRPGTRKSDLLPGRVDGRIIAWPMLALWLIGASTALWLNYAYRPETTPALAGLYVSAGFFAHFYALLFMAGSRVRRTLFAGITTLLMALLTLHHADEMPSRRVISGQQWVDIPSRPEWGVPIGCAVLFIILLWVHAAWLATGTRPKPGRAAATGGEASAPSDASAEAEAASPPIEDLKVAPATTIGTAGTSEPVLDAHTPSDPTAVAEALEVDALPEVPETVAPDPTTPDVSENEPPESAREASDARLAESEPETEESVRAGMSDDRPPPTAPTSAPDTPPAPTPPAPTPPDVDDDTGATIK